MELGWKMNLLEQIHASTNPGPLYEELGPTLLDDTTPLVRVIAFCLPQFHPIPENDEWWGKGFTEWTNVTKAIPRFAGHYQPRLPGELGFYNLTDPSILRRQAELARRSGLSGFCFHHYWFAGRKLLEQPIEILRANEDIDLPYCINWANENWTRRWDGRDQDVLLEQRHSPEDDLAFAESIEKYLRDPRYIRINGRPLLMLYRPSLLPEARATVLRWREFFRRVGIGEIYVTMAQAFSDSDHEKYGMDAAVGFPPFWTGGDRLRRLKLFDPSYCGDVCSYESLVKRTVDGYSKDWRVFPGVCPSWDNEARKPGKGFCFTGSTPSLYAEWLAAACQASMAAFPPGERLVFVNAWNEWAEGAYLEPDRRFGYAYLAQTARVLKSLLDIDGRTQPSSQLPAVTALSTVKQSFRSRTCRLGRRMLEGIARRAELLARWLRRL